MGWSERGNDYIGKTNRTLVWGGRGGSTGATKEGGVLGNPPAPLRYLLRGGSHHIFWVYTTSKVPIQRTNQVLRTSIQDWEGVWPVKELITEAADSVSRQACSS